MNEWKTALQSALAQAPSAALVMGQTGIFRNDGMESIEASFEQCNILCSCFSCYFSCFINETYFGAIHATLNLYFTRKYDIHVFSGRDRRSAKSMIIGRPILLALEDIDGSPSFLEKALRFIEQYGKTFIF